jgi:hypothetical protein
MNILKKTWLFLFPLTLVLGCFSHGAVRWQDEARARLRAKQKMPIPDSVIAKSDSIIVSKTGPDFFHKYIHRVNYDTSSGSVFDLPCLDTHPAKALLEEYPEDPDGGPDHNIPYTVLYRFKIPGKPWIDEPIRFYFDSTGSVIGGPPQEIPEYLAHPDSCTFGIDSVTAINIARKAGFEEGISPWEMSFGWSNEGLMNKKYTWVVRNTLHHWEGHIIWIDPNSGVVLQRGEWTVEQ